MADRIVASKALTLASISSHLADTLYRFVDEHPEAAREIRSVISTLFEIKTLLIELDAKFMDPRFASLVRQLLDDIALGVSSCSSSLRDLDGIVLRCSMTRRGSSPRSARKSWNEILSSFRNIEGMSLQARLDVHRAFLFNVAALLRITFVSPAFSKRGEHRAEMKQFQDQIRQLAMQQEKVTARMREVEEAHRRTVEEAYHRYSPPASAAAPSPSPPMAPGPALATPAAPYDSPPRRPYSTPIPSPPFPLPVDSYRYVPTTLHETRPMTPVSPISPISPISPLGPPMPPLQRRYSMTPAPTMSNRMATPAPMNRMATPAPTLSHRLSTPPATPPMARSKMRGNPQLPSKGSQEKWWAHVFGMNPGSTSLSEPPQQSKCYGAQMDHLSMAPEEHEIFRVEFDSELMLRMFRDAASEEAKIVCTMGGSGGSWSSGRRNGYRFQTAINASKLNVARVGPGIQLTRRNLVWADLYFSDFETLTLFYHAFLALRHNAPSAPIPKETEYWLDGESLLFSANIDDGGYTHALRLLRDKESGCVRLAAAKADEEQDVTVWTAFITNQICASNWLHHSRPKCVKVQNIRQFSFSSCFETNLRGEFEIRFLQQSDAMAFTLAINREARRISGLRTADYHRHLQGVGVGGSPVSPHESYF